MADNGEEQSAVAQQEEESPEQAQEDGAQQEEDTAAEAQEDVQEETVDQEPEQEEEAAETADAQEQQEEETTEDSQDAEAQIEAPTEPQTIESENASPQPTEQTNQAEETPAVPTPPPGPEEQKRAAAPPPPKAPTTVETVVPAPPPPMTGMNTRSETLSSVEDKAPPTALSLQWSFGMNRSVSVINLTDEHRKMIAYTCAQTAILYDFANNKQYLLQGHSNAISCMCVSADKRWLATADRGEDSLLIVWDTYTGIPVRTIFEPHPEGGCSALALTPDAKLLATVSSGETQTLALWDWTTESDKPLCSARLRPEYGEQTYVHFNPEDVSQLVSKSDSQVLFYSWKASGMEYFAPSLTDDDFNKPVGKYSQSIFVAGTSRALSATSLGNLVVWDTTKATKQGAKSVADKRAVKLVKLQERGVNVLTTTDSYIVTGDVLGHVKFLDSSLKLVSWYQDLHLGPVTAISFAYFPEFNNPFNPVSGQYPADATIRANQFVIRDFVIGTSNAVYSNLTTDGTDISVILREHDAAVYGLAAHPSRDLLAVGSYSGLLKLWDYESKTVHASRRFEKGLMIRCCQFDPRGQFLAVGFTNGMLRVLDAVSLKNLQPTPFRYSRDAITNIAFSHNSRYLAVSDAEHTMSLFRRCIGTGVVEEGEAPPPPYRYVGRYRAHYKMIVDIMFGTQLDSCEPRLLSLGEDRHLVEYDLEGSTDDDLRILSSVRIEQSAVPLCMEWYPPVTKESFILTANDQYKYKLYNATTKMCRKTLLAPTYNSPIQKMVVLPVEDPVSDLRHVAYITLDKIGLNALPLDGNPHNTMALVAHPQGVVNLACSHDGKYLFSAGGVDASVHMWDINLQALQVQSRLGGEGLTPFYGLLEGNREGELFKELEDYFYYAQLRSQGINTMDVRRVVTQIPVSEIPYVIRALGFYPSEQEIEDMLNEVKYSTYVETGQYKTHVDMDDFIRLYVNHRPAFGLQPEKLLWAFDVLGDRDSSDVAASVYRGELLDLLQNRGEHMTEYELAECLTTLLGFNEEGGSSELQQFDAARAGDLIDQSLPHQISGAMFANELLGFSMYDADVLQLEQQAEVAQ